MKPVYFTVLLVLMVMSAACASTRGGKAALSKVKAKEVESLEELDNRHLMQLAQQEANRKRWNTALRYYQQIVDRNAAPEYLAPAKFEIAFITYKQKEYQEAAEKFRSFLEEYEMHPEYPLWTKVLSEKVLAIIEEKLAKKKPSTR